MSENPPEWKCDGKWKYLTFTAAKAAARRAKRRRYGVAVVPYRCNYCQHFHVGHAVGRLKTKRWETTKARPRRAELDDDHETF